MHFIYVKIPSVPLRIKHIESSGRLIRAEKKIQAGHFGSALKDISISFYAALGHYGIHLESNPTNITGSDLLRFWIRKFGVDAKRFSKFEVIAPNVKFNFVLQRFEPTKEQKTFLLSKNEVQFCFDFALQSILQIESEFERLMR
ncbi:MAG: hypothetical protein R2883_06270 [Caldisericia bacterium]